MHCVDPELCVAGLLEVYLVVSCCLSACSLLATLLHSIPHPNHILFYNFSIIALSYVLDVTVGGQWAGLNSCSEGDYDDS